jgi:hypothetical protein
VSDTQVIIVLAVGASVFVLFCCLILVVMIRMRRVVTSQLETIDNLLSTLRADQGRDATREHPSEP